MVDWGPEIVVNGIRPDWLRDDEIIDWCWQKGDGRWIVPEWYTDGKPAGSVNIENGCRAIRLRADHPHYKQTATTAHMNGRVRSPLALIREAASILDQSDARLTITITGPQGSGKTRWAELIRNLPASLLGFPVPMVVDGEEG